MNIYDIAQKAGVSTATVSRVINGSKSVSEETRRKVNAIMAQEGYSPNVFARGLMVNSMKTIGVMTIDVRDLYYAQSIHTIESEARGLGYNVVLCNTGVDMAEKKRYLKLLLQKRVDGIILIGSVFAEKTDNEYISEAASKIPVVMINGYLEGDNIYSVVCNDSGAVKEAVDHLVRLGHRNISFIYDVETYSAMEKLNGYKSAMQEHGLQYGGTSIFHVESGIKGGYAAAKQLMLDNPECTAIIASEDILAVGALKAYTDAGYNVPNDISIIGYNNSVLAECTTPELTSIENKVEKLSSVAVDLLIKAINGKAAHHRFVEKAELIIRKSVKEI